MHSVELMFKGNRDYAHGTDIFNAMLRFVQNELGLELLEKIDMTIHRMVRKNLRVEVLRGTDAFKDSSVNIVFSFWNAGEKINLFLYETESPIQGRYAYDEDVIETHSRSSAPGEISLSASNDLGLSWIELVVALNKIMLGHNYPDFSGKWLFTRIQIKRLNPATVNNSSDLSVQLKNNFNFKLTKSVIRSGEEDFGSLFFSAS